MIPVKLKIKLKLATDVFMTIALLLLMTYEMIGSEMHEWIGMAMFILFVLHHVLNIHWSKNIFKGRYTVFRYVQTTLVIFIFLLC